MGQTCPGYRDTLSLTFRNETDRVIERVNAKGGSASPSEETPSVWAADMISSVRNLASTSVSSGIPPTTEELGAGYFLEGVVAGSRKHLRGYLDYVSDVYIADNYNDILLGSMSAVGLAALARTSHQPYTAHALSKYGDVVQRINVALGSRDEAVRDSILMATIILALFEQMRGEAAWARHVRGAAALVALRGTAQFRSSIGIRMFAQVSGDLVVASLRERVRIPEHMFLLRAEATKYVEPDDFVWLANDANVRCVDFLFRRLYGNIIHLSEILAEALELDQKYQTVFQLLTAQSPYRIIHDPALDSRLAYKHRYDIYENVYILRVWNGARAGRILLHEAIRKHLMAAHETFGGINRQHADQLQNSSRLIFQMRDEVFASVPQALGYVSDSQTDLATVPSFWSESQVLRDKPFIRIAGPNFMYWTIFLAAKTSATRDEDRTWLVDRLSVIGNRMGIPSALNLAHELETKKPMIFDR